jgi:hypothetical protein
MMNLLSTALSKIGLNNIILGVLIIAALGSFAYQNKKISSQNETITSLNEDIEKKKDKLAQAQNDNKNIIEAYEKTLAIERQIAKEQSVTTEQKEKVVIKYQTLIKEVQKRGEIKQDENSNFTIVSF